ncbi:MAG: ComF family protein [Propionicimonas sp.]|uniref:ComF family protein n=1 Tax=Propionicimonas sp. TaxID=1955623 RepID=UPI002B1F455D|nr:ComF family protein [Propionicimonas sp.]MEA4944686.1 ComF family protein [Propionicimonas sp.]MEA5052705.1 ComF family protein [Propionicimonas sp.]
MELRGVRDALGDLVLGARCAGCGVTALGLCQACRDALEGLRPVPVSRSLPGFPPTMAAGEYSDRLRRVILATKERGALGHLPVLGDLLTRAVAGVLLTAPATATPVLLVPVPSAHSRVVERGLDLTFVLARRAARRLSRQGATVRVLRAVGLGRVPDDQAGLGREARVLNSSGAYTWRVGTAGSVVVVDDVVTTGATLSAIGAAAASAGVAVLGAATVAHTARRGNSPTGIPAPQPW